MTTFVWNNVNFRCRPIVDGNPNDGGSFWLDRLWVVNGETEVEVTDLLQDEYLANALSDIAFDYWHAENAKDEP